MPMCSSVFKSCAPPSRSISCGSGQRTASPKCMGGAITQSFFDSGRNQQMFNLFNKLSNKMWHQQGGVASRPASDLRKSLNSAERNYTGCDYQVKHGFKELDKQDAELQREIKKLGRYPSKQQLQKVMHLAAALADKIEDLKNQPGLEGNSQILNQLDKAENAANGIYRELKDKLHEMRPSMSKPAADLRKSLNQAERNYTGNDCQVKHGFKELDKQDAELQREIKKLGRYPSKQQLEKVMHLAKATLAHIEYLKNQSGLEGNSQILKQLDKAENAANDIYKEAKNELKDRHHHPIFFPRPYPVWAGSIYR